MSETKNKPTVQQVERVMKAAIAFVLLEWDESVKRKGSIYISCPPDFRELHDAVCDFKGWNPQGEYPEVKG